MKITIKYCGMCLYEASGLEAAIRKNTIIDDIGLREGNTGVFDVFVDGVVCVVVLCGLLLHATVWRVVRCYSVW